MNTSKNIKLSIGTKENLGKVKNVEMTWHDFCEKLSTPLVDKISMSQYSALTKLGKGDAKAKPGFFLAGHCKDGVRQNSKIEFRSLITLDADDVVDDELYTQIKEGQLEDLEFEAFVYTTRSHTPAAPRFRIVIPLETQITDPDAYAAVARLVASRIDATMQIWDPCSFRPAQMMYLPSVACDQEFIAKRMTGSLCDPELILEECDGDWRDISNLPRSQKEIKKLKPSRSSRQRASSGDGCGVLADPAKKTGVVGAFCRAYTVEEAIEKFIPSVYTYAGDKSGCARYTYTEGSSFGGGAVLGGTHFYSHHATDPANDGSAHNAFDIVRIHKFGHLDEFQSHNISELESHKAMHEFSLKDDEVVANFNTSVSADDFDVSDDVNEDDDAHGDQDDPMAIFEELLARSEGNQTDDVCAAGAFDVSTEDDALIDDIEEAFSNQASAADLGAGGGIFSALAQKVAAESDQDEIDDVDWLSTLERHPKTNKILKSTYAIAQIIANDTRFAKAFAFNEFVQDTVLIRDIDTKISEWKPLKARNNVSGDLINDRHVSTVIAALSTPEELGGYGISANNADVMHAISVVATKNAFHPVRDYLEKVEWDGTARVEKSFIEYLGAADNVYTRAVAKLFFKAAVARIFQPGVKFDNAVIFEGIQGIRKTSFIEAISAGFFGRMSCRLVTDINKTVEAIHGNWIVEMPEMCGISSVDPRDIRTFLDQKWDRARLSYRRNAEDFIRQCVVVGSTNEVQYLEDETGNRRFWPLRCSTDIIDIDRVIEDRDQLWAEAVQMYRNEIEEFGAAQLFIDEKKEPELARIAKSLQSSRKAYSERDMLEDDIVDFVTSPKISSDIADYDTSNMWKEVQDCGETRFVCTHLTLQFIWNVILEREPSDYDKEAGKFARLVGSMPFLEQMDGKRVLPVSKTETKRSRGYRVIHEVLK